MGESLTCLCRQTLGHLKQSRECYVIHTAGPNTRTAAQRGLVKWMTALGLDAESQMPTTGRGVHSKITLLNSKPGVTIQ